MNKQRITTLILLSIVAVGLTYVYFTSCSSGTIKRIDSYQEVVEQLKATDSNTLVLFDVDDTLIMPADVMLQSKTKEQHQEWLTNIINQLFKLVAHAEEYYWDYWEKSPHPFMLIDPLVVQLIADLQRRDVPVFALTLATTGKRGRFIPFYPEYRFNTLSTLGIDLSNADITDTTFTQLRKHNDAYPMFYKGILFANFTNKGDVLGAFLDYMQWQPDKVIFFDDSLKRLNEVMQECRKRNIPFIGYHYFGAEHVAGDLDKKVAEIQLHYLIDHEEWISDAQIKALTAQ